VTRSSLSTRRKGAMNTAVFVLAGVSVVAHAAVLAVVDVHTPKFSGVMPVMVPAGPCEGPECPRELVLSCEADVLFGAAARMATCSSPFAARTCAREVTNRLELDLYQCHEDPEMAGRSAVALEDIEVVPKPLMPEVQPMDDVVAAQLIEKEVAEKLEQAQKELQKPNATGQIVEIAKPEVEMTPDKARYLSEFDSKTEKQTVARGSTEKMVAKPAPKELPPTAMENPPDPTAPDKKTEAAAREASKAPGQGPGDSPSTLSMRGPGSASESPAPPRTAPGDTGGEKVATIDGIQPKAGQGGMWSRATGLEPPGGAEKPGGGEGQKQSPKLRPSDDLLERAVGGGSVDHIEDADEGEFTSLNSRKWKYATFFNRMKRQVAQNWHPDQVYLRRDPNGNIYGTRDRLTVLRVSLKPDGSVAKIYVSKQSGVDFLDDEAVRAFQEAQPFPNPPGGLVDPRSNQITFSFGFHFQIGGDRSRWKVFRYQ
jgi:TonB family protein